MPDSTSSSTRDASSGVRPDHHNEGHWESLNHTQHNYESIKLGLLSASTLLIGLLWQKL